MKSLCFLKSSSTNSSTNTNSSLNLNSNYNFVFLFSFIISAFMISAFMLLCWGFLLPGLADRPLYVLPDYAAIASCQDVTVTIGEVQEKIREWNFQNAGIKIDEPRIRLLIESLVLEKLVVSKAKKEEYHNKPSFIYARESLLKKMYMHAFIRSLRTDVKALPMTISPKEKEEAQRYYKINEHLFNRPELIGADIIAAENKEKCMQALMDINQGMPFEEAVKKYSIHSSNINNGFIGYVRKGYTWDDIIVDRLTELPVNGITDVIQTSRGWAIFRKRDVKPALNLSYDEVEKRIVTMLRNKKTAPEMANLKALSNELKRLVQSVDLDREELMSVLNTAETDVRKGIVNNYSQEKLDKPILKAQGFSYTVRDLVTALNSMDSVDRMQVMSNPGAMVDFILDIRNQEVLFKEAVARGLKMDRREQGLYEKSLNTILIDNYLEDLAIKRLKVDQKEVEELYKTRKKYHPHIFTSIQKAETAYILEKKAQLKNAVLEDIKAESDLLIDQGIYETFLKKFE